MENFDQFKRFSAGLTASPLMPVIFMGHGSPMNGIVANEFNRKWAELAGQIPIPKAVLVVSAHWMTNGTKITAMDFPETIHDFGGFPPALNEVQYPAPGDQRLAREIVQLTSGSILLDHDWGLDHGAWTIIRHMYPKADIPVLQLSIDYRKSPQQHYELAKELQQLRRKGILILSSGNMVHNLRMIDWKMIDGGGYDWALAANQKFKQLIMDKDFQSLIDYGKLGQAVALAIPTPEHYIPLMYTLGLQNDNDRVSFFNDKAVGGSLTMTSVLMG